MEIPVQYIECCTRYNDLSLVAKTFNRASLDYFLWVHLPEEFKYCSFVQIDELLPKRRCIDVGPAIERQKCRPWLRIVFPVLDQDAGLHIYKITFVNRYTDDVVSAYISYAIQDDNPNKPYIYMRQEDASGDE